MAGSAPEVSVYWQPHCSSCAYVKEYLSRHGVDYRSVNVLAEASAAEELRSLGAKSVPVVARGGAFVYAQSIDDVAAFVGLDDRSERLSDDELAARIDAILDAAEGSVGQVPDEALDTLMPNRPRSYRTLAHHAFRVVESFLESVDGERLTYESLIAPPPPSLQSSGDIARYGGDVRRRFNDWWERSATGGRPAEIDTYYGAKPFSEVLLRTASHAGQHARQLVELLEGLDIVAEHALPQTAFKGLLVAEAALDR